MRRIDDECHYHARLLPLPFFRCSKDKQIKNEIQKKIRKELYYFIISIARARVSHRLHTHVYNVCTCNCALLLSLFHHFLLWDRRSHRP